MCAHQIWTKSKFTANKDTLGCDETTDDDLMMKIVERIQNFEKRNIYQQEKNSCVFSIRCDSYFIKHLQAMASENDFYFYI